MNDKFSNFVNSRLFIIILIGILVSSTVFIGTYAWFTWSSTNDTQGNTLLTMTIGQLADVTFEEGKDITGALNPVFYYSDGLSTTFTINNNDTTGTSASYNIIFNITSIDPVLINHSSNIKYVVLKNGEIVGENSLTGADNNTSITLYTGDLDSGTTTHAVYLYIDSNINNSREMIGKNITGNITVVEATA